MTRNTKTVTADDPPSIHHLTRDQARAIITDAGLDPDNLPDKVPGPDATGTDRVVRHYKKWLRDPDTTTTIPLTKAELAALPQGMRPKPVEG